MLQLTLLLRDYRYNNAVSLVQLLNFATLTKTVDLVVQAANANDVMIEGAKFIDELLITWLVLKQLQHRYYYFKR
jgi:hypothetical protein